MKYQAYGEYKDSGVEWLGRIPSQWDVKRLGHFFEERREKVSDKEYPALSVTKLGIVPQLDNAAKTDAGDNRKLVLKDDFVINSRSDRKGSSGVSPHDGSVSLISIVQIPRKIIPEFAHHLLRSYAFQEEFYRYGKGIVADLWSTNSSEMKNILLPDISKEEQIQIANFLDHETAKIDTLIEKQQQLIKLLKEKRQAVISHAVTKGLNPNAPMRDSGVEWLGEVPEHWEVKRLKFVCEFISQKVAIGKKKVIALENIESWSGKYIKTESSYSGEDVEFKRGDILFGKLRPYLAKVFFSEESGVAFGDLLVYRPNASILGKYCFYQMINEAFISIVDSSTYGSKMPRASADFINDMAILLPPMEEQKKVVSKIETNLKRFNEIENKAIKAIHFMQERRTALISAAVTGKIDVRNWQAPNPENKLVGWGEERTPT